MSLDTLTRFQVMFLGAGIAHDNDIVASRSIFRGWPEIIWC